MEPIKLRDMATSKAQWKGTIKEGKGTMTFTGYEGVLFPDYVQVERPKYYQKLI